VLLAAFRPPLLEEVLQRCELDGRKLAAFLLSSSLPSLLIILSLSSNASCWSEDYSLHAATCFDPWFIPSFSPVSLFADGLMTPSYEKRRANVLGWLQRPREIRCCYLHFARLFRQRCCCSGVNSIVADSLQFSPWISLLLFSCPAHRIIRKK